MRRQPDQSFIRTVRPIQWVAVLLLLAGVACAFASGKPWKVLELWEAENSLAALASGLIVLGSFILVGVYLKTTPNELVLLQPLGVRLDELDRSPRSGAMKAVLRPLVIMRYCFGVLALIIGILSIPIGALQAVAELGKYIFVFM